MAPAACGVSERRRLIARDVWKRDRAERTPSSPRDAHTRTHAMCSRPPVERVRVRREARVLRVTERVPVKKWEEVTRRRLR